MFTPIALSTLLAGSPVFISQVTSDVRTDEISVEISGETALDAIPVRTDLSGRRLVLSLKDTRVRRNNRAWGEGAGTIRAHRHATHTELSVPVPGGKGCTGPARTTATGTGGLRITVACPGLTPDAVILEAPVVARAAAPAKVEPIGEAPRPQVAAAAAAAAAPEPVSVAAPVVAVGAPPAAAAPAEPSVVSADSARLLAALALESGDAKPSVIPTSQVPAAAKSAPALEAEKIHDEKTTSTSKPAAPESSVAAAGSPSLPSSSSGSWRVVVVPVGALIVLGLASLFLGRRRKAAGRMVTIVETASLGPKRALIVARVDGETLVLGSSEAGITLLRSRNGAAESGARFGSSADGFGDTAGGHDDDRGADRVGRFSPGRAAVDDDVVADSPGQVRFLARLFGSRKSKMVESEVEPWNFDGLLEDSIEDQELRRKLASGLGARVR